MDNQPLTPQELPQQPVVSQSQTPQVASAAPKHSKLLPILTVLALVLIAGVGYGVYSWQHGKVTSSNTKVASLQSQLSSLQSQVNKLSKQSTQPTTTTTPANTTTQSTTTTPTSYFTISQWGIKASYSGSLTLQYAPDSNPSNQMFVSSNQLNAGGPSICTTANGAAGYIGRYLPTDNIPTEGPPGETAQQYISGGGTAPYAKVGNYYYIYFTGQGNDCASTTLLQQTQAAFSALVPKLVSD